MIALQFITVLGIRVMVSMLFQLLEIHYTLNHIQLPRPGWKLETVKIVLTAVIAVPVISRMH